MVDILSVFKESKCPYLTPRREAVLVKLIVTQLAYKFPIFVECMG
jgi:hypothetical protein